VLETELVGGQPPLDESPNGGATAHAVRAEIVGC
jgi:hypothetical protein